MVTYELVCASLAEGLQQAGLQTMEVENSVDIHTCQRRFRVVCRWRDDTPSPQAWVEISFAWDAAQTALSLGRDDGPAADEEPPLAEVAGLGPAPEPAGRSSRGLHLVDWPAADGQGREDSPAEGLDEEAKEPELADELEAWELEDGEEELEEEPALVLAIEARLHFWVPDTSGDDVARRLVRAAGQRIADDPPVLTLNTIIAPDGTALRRKGEFVQVWTLDLDVPGTGLLDFAPLIDEVVGMRAAVREGLERPGPGPGPSRRPRLPHR